MRIVLVLLVFQFFSPAFLPVAAALGSDNEQKPVTIHTEHSSIVLPLILKEKDENEHEEAITTFALTPLIDFTDHSLALTESHELKYNPALGQHYNHQPPLFSLFCAFII